MPRWGGTAPQFLGFELCQAMRDVLAAEQPPPFLHPSAEAVIAEMRQSFDGLVEPHRFNLEETDDGVMWWTFAGGRINATLVRAVETLESSFVVTSDNHYVRIVTDGLGIPGVRAVLERLAEPEVWEDTALWEQIGQALPSYRLSKFQDVLPSWAAQEMVAAFLLDVEGAWRWVSGLQQAAAPAGAQAVRQGLQRDVDAEPIRLEAPSFLQPRRPIRWVRSDAELVALCHDLAAEPRVALDVETTLRTRTLCLVQLGTPSLNALIDPFEIDDLTPLAELLQSRTPLKIIHNARFERDVLGRLGMEIRGVVDTLDLSRNKHGRGKDGGHGLAAVVHRELGFDLDKTEQTSRWERRPLTPRQEAYAALDVEVLIDVVELLQVTAQGGLFEG